MSKFNDKIIIAILFISSLSFIYTFSITAFNGDSNQYYSWVKDIYTGHGGYFSWTTAAGYNQYSIIHVFSAIIGIFAYKSATLFFLVVNYAELILIAIAGIIFVKITNTDDNSNVFQRWIYGLPFGIVIWTGICLFAKSTTQSVALQATDLFLIFVDSFIIISIGWFLSIINKIHSLHKIPVLQLIIFTTFSIYFSSTTLRFLSGAILTEIFLLTIIIIHQKLDQLNNSSIIKNTTFKPHKERILNETKLDSSLNTTHKFDSINIDKFIYQTYLTILAALIIIFIIGYYGFFALETFSSSARFVLRGGETNFTQEWYNATTALQQYLTLPELSILNIFLRFTYLIVFGYGVKVLLQEVLSRKISILTLTISQLFGLLTIINFILVTIAGLFSHGTVFLDTGNIAHYYELSAIFAFLTVLAFTLELLKDKHVRLISITGLSLGTVFSIYYINSQKSFLQPPFADLSKCINENKAQYNLKNGMGDFWVVNPLMAQNTAIRFSVIGSMKTNLDYNWQRNLTESISNNNFLVYTDQSYRQNTLNLIKNKIPSLNYQTINCNNDSGIIVFDQKTTASIDTFRNTEFNNAKSWFYISNYGAGQTLWGEIPWNSKFISQHHEYYYNGSLLHRLLPSAQCKVNEDLSISINGMYFSQTHPVLTTEMIHAGSGSYYVNVNYKLTANISRVEVINLRNKQLITSMNLTPGKQSIHFDFTLDHVTPIKLTIQESPQSQLTVNDITVGKYH